MATKKSATAAKKPATKKKAAPSVAKASNVTTVKTVSTRRPSIKKLNLSRSPLVAAGVAEFIGAFALAGIFLATQGASIYILFGLVGLTLAVGVASGAHFNPAITLAALVTRRIKAARAVVYIFAQVLGAMLALVIMNAYINGGTTEASEQAAMLGQAGVSLFELSALPSGKEWYIVGAEALGALLFGFGFANALAARTRSSAAWMIGGSFFVAMLIGTFLTTAVTSSANAMAGAAPLSTVLNPAVAVALQGLSFSWWPIAVYVLAPVFGAVLGFVIRDLVASEPVEK